MVGILVEAFVPRQSRYTAQVVLAVVGLAAAFAAVVALAEKGYGTTKAHIAAMGAVAVDGPALFLQGTILLVSIVAVFTFAERRLDPMAHGNRVDSFAAQGSAVPGGDQEKAAVKAGFTSTEVFPLLLFAVGGMLIFPAANDLLTLFVALEVFSLPAVHPVRAGPPPPADVPGSGRQVLPARRLLLGLPAVRHRAALRLRGQRVVLRHRLGHRRHRQDRRRRWPTPRATTRCC